MESRTQRHLDLTKQRDVENVLRTAQRPNPCGVLPVALHTRNAYFTRSYSTTTRRTLEGYTRHLQQQVRFSEVIDSPSLPAAAADEQAVTAADSELPTYMTPLDLLDAAARRREIAVQLAQSVQVHASFTSRGPAAPETRVKSPRSQQYLIRRPPLADFAKLTQYVELQPRIAPDKAEMQLESGRAVVYRFAESSHSSESNAALARLRRTMQNRRIPTSTAAERLALPATPSRASPRFQAASPVERVWPAVADNWAALSLTCTPERRTAL